MSRCLGGKIGSIPVGDSGFFFAPRSCRVNQFTFHISLSRSKFTIFIHVVETQAKIHLLGMLNHIVMQTTLTSFLPILIYQKWSNPLLRWNESDFEGIRKLHVEPKRVWVPDIHLYNK